MSAPVVLRGGQSATVVATPDQGYLWVAGPGRVNADRVAVPRSFASATVTARGDIIVVNAHAGITRVRLYPRAEVVSQTPIVGDSVAPAAASRTHFYVATDKALWTFDAQSFANAGVFQWEGGGFWGPAIGPTGRVYAIANDSLYVFAAPPCHGLLCRRQRNSVTNGGVAAPTQH